MEEFNGIIINASDFGNSSLILTILIKNEIKKGLFRSAKNNNICVVGNYVYCKKFGKKDSLGVIVCEIIMPYGINYFNNKALITILIISYEIKLFLKENIENENIYNFFLHFLKSSFTLSVNDLKVKNYLLEIEFEILQECGILTNETKDKNVFFAFYNVTTNKKELDKIKNLRNLLF